MRILVVVTHRDIFLVERPIRGWGVPIRRERLSLCR